MKVFFDTEFLDQPPTLELISIGMVREDGEALYRENSEFPMSKATPWLRSYVIPKLDGGACMMSPERIAEDIREFAGSDPEFWAYYADYDWVVLCRLFGSMMKLPEGWPMYCRDIKQWADQLGNPVLPPDSVDEHNALADARWTAEAWDFLNDQSRR